MTGPHPFSGTGLTPELMHAATACAMTTPTPIQLAAIPPILQGVDLRGCAPTGSGKTAAYALPVLQQLLGGTGHTPRRPRALVLVPTRELAAQAGETLRSLSQHLPTRLKVAVVFGGVSANPQMLALRGGADVVVATPGRLLDLVRQNALKLSSVATLVLDEADRLLELGFADEMQQVLALLPRRRQNLLFSATFPAAVEGLATSLLHAPVTVDVPSTGISEPVITQRAIAVDPARRTALLRHLIATEHWERVLVFVATQYATEHVAWKLYQAGTYATPFHGGLSQGARRKVLQEFKDGQWDVLVTTDLAARGLDIAQLPAVVNYDLPRSATDYIHRIGRTGRAGESGVAVSFVSADTEAHFRLIEKRQGLSLPLEEVAGFEPAPRAETPATTVERAAVPGTGGIKGKRPSKKDKLRAAAAQAAAAGSEPG